MNVVKVKLPSGSWRYVTTVYEDDIGCSIYNVNAVDESKLEKCRSIYPNLEFKIEEKK